MLLSPDGRAVVVMCESRLAQRMAGHAGRSQGLPRCLGWTTLKPRYLAKLEWFVSLDGAKMQPETSKLLARK